MANNGSTALWTEFNTLCQTQQSMCMHDIPVAAEADEAGEKVVVLPVAAEERVNRSGPTGLVVATVLGLLAVIAVIGAAATLAFRRRRKSHREEIALEKVVENNDTGFLINTTITRHDPCLYWMLQNYDTLAANALLEEAEYHASIYTPPVHERPAPPPPI